MSTPSSSPWTRVGWKAVCRLALFSVVVTAGAALSTEGAIGAAGPTPSLPAVPPPPPATTVLLTGAASAVRANSYTVPVLMYHRITCAPRDARLPGLWVCPRVFARTMRLLKAHGWDTITSAELADARAADRPLPRRSFVIVFDDGNRDGYDNAYPILERFGFEGVFAVVVGRVGVKRRAMTWAELRDLQAAGHEIANHSLHHADVTRLDRAGLAREVGLAAERLHRHLGSWPRTFVYPFGRWDGDGIAAVRTTHHHIAYTTVPGATRRSTERFTAPRIRVSRSDSPEGILRRLSAFD